VPHNRDHSIKEFFLNLEHNVAEYTLLSPDKREVLIFKSYSVDNLSEDLLGILFKSFDRPWHGGPKYKKRVDRFFFLVLAEILANLGSGENASEYIQAQQESMVAPLKNLYPVGDKSVEIIGQVSAQLAQMKKDFPDMTFAHSFWQNMINLAEKHLLRDLKADDQKGFNELLKAAQENLDIAAQISEIPGIKINLNKVYQSDINKIF
jgi:hypothetical protein